MGTQQAPDSKPAARPGDPIDLSESVAGEEDPGASVDIVGTPAEPPADKAKPGAKPEARPDDRPAAGKERQAG